MPIVIDPGGGGDPVMTALDGTQFKMTGKPHALHRVYSRGPLKVDERWTPIGWNPGEPDPPEGTDQYVSTIDIRVGDCLIVVGADGKTHVILPDHHIVVQVKCDTIDAPGHPGSTSDDPHPLQGVAHLNMTMPIIPRFRLGETGILADGVIAAEHPEHYLVPG